jgi:hypothetical protein
MAAEGFQGPAVEDAHEDSLELNSASSSDLQEPIQPMVAADTTIPDNSQHQEISGPQAALTSNQPWAISDNLDEQRYLLVTGLEPGEPFVLCPLAACGLGMCAGLWTARGRSR